MAVIDAARKTVRRLSDRVDRPGHTMSFEDVPGGFLHWFREWQRMGGLAHLEQRAVLKLMQDSCIEQKIITAEEIAAINERYGVEP